MLSIFIIILISLISTVIPLYPELTLSILKVNLVLYIILIFVDIATTKRITLFSTWIVSYIYIIWSDMVLTSYNYDNVIYSIPIFFYLIGNSCVLLGYTMNKKKTKKFSYTKQVVQHPNYLLLFIFLSVVVFLYLQLDTIKATMAHGRVLNSVKGSGNLLYSLVGGIGLVIPATIAYYFKFIKKKSIIYSIILVAPIFIFQFILSTRFKLLFQLLPFLFVSGVIKIKQLNIKSILVLCVCAILFSATSSFMKENRTAGYGNISQNDYIYTNDVSSDKFVELAKGMSPEGIINMAHLANRYFEVNDLKYGKEVSFLLYFWVPRSIWKNKPTPIDNWLIRKYEIVSDEHSSASGFLGELRADFGWFALIFAFGIGYIIMLCDNYIYNIMQHTPPPFQVTIATMLYPYFFFFVRSPITSTINLFFALLIYFIIVTFFCKKIKSCPNSYK